jgi:hypothetical protein
VGREGGLALLKKGAETGFGDTERRADRWRVLGVLKKGAEKGVGDRGRRVDRWRLLALLKKGAARRVLGKGRRGGQVSTPAKLQSCERLGKGLLWPRTLPTHAHSNTRMHIRMPTIEGGGRERDDETVVYGEERRW